MRKLQAVQSAWVFTWSDRDLTFTRTRPSHYNAMCGVNKGVNFLRIRPLFPVVTMQQQMTVLYVKHQIHSRMFIF